MSSPTSPTRPTATGVRSIRTTGWTALVLPAVLLVLAVAVGIEVGHVPSSPFIALPFYAAGYVILRKVGSHAIGWLLGGLGLVLQVATEESLPWLSDLWLQWLFGWTFSLMFALFTWLLILFPDGRASRRWTIAGWIATALVIGGILQPNVTDVNDSSIVVGINPTGVGWLPEEIGLVTNAAITALLVGAAIGVVARGRRAAPDLRLRYKPVLATMSLLGVLILVLLVWLIIDPNFTAGGTGDIVWSVALVVYMLIPASFGVAITRYRLYDIDRVVSRTVAYSLVALVVAAIYAIPVVALPGWLGESNDLVVAGSTLAAAAAFNPIRRRIQHAVDHRFDRARYDAEREVSAFATRLEASVDLDLLTEDLTQVVDRTLSPTCNLVWIRETG
jgi:hypothetical protein